MTKEEILIEDVSDGLVGILLDEIWKNAEAYGKTELGLTDSRDIIRLYVLLADRTIKKLKKEYKVGVYRGLLEELGL